MSAESFRAVAEVALRAIPLAAGSILLLVALNPWRELSPQPASAPAS